MSEELIRTSLLIGEDSVERLAKCKVAVFGVGGVGGYVAEALARSGVGNIDLFDKDEVSLSNINRQIIALHSTVGKNKAVVMKERIADINPEINVNAYEVFYLPENADQYPFNKYDYIVDAVDTVTAKIEIITRAVAKNIPVISSMGAGNKLDPCQFEAADISQTSVCPLARVMRRELKKRDIEGVKVVYSKEQAKKPSPEIVSESGKVTPGSVAYVPSVAGLIIAGEVVHDLTQNIV